MSRYQQKDKCPWAGLHCTIHNIISLRVYDVYYCLQSSDKLAMVNNAPLLVEFGQQEMITLDNLLYEAGGDDTAHLLEYQITVPPRAGEL